MVDADGLSPLEHAGRAGQHEALRQLLDAVTDLNLLTTTCKVEAKHLKAAGIALGKLVTAGYTVDQLLDAGYSLVDVDIDFGAARELGTTASRLKAAGIASGKLAAAGYTVEEALAGGYSVEDLGEGFDEVQACN